MTDETTPSGQALAFVLLSNALAPPESGVSDALRAAGGGRIVDGGEDAVMVELDGFRGFVALMPAPVPGDEVKKACSASLLWPSAWEAVGGHVAHWVVGIAVAQDALLNGWLGFTRFVAELARVDGVLGVYWGSAGVVHAPDFLLEESRRASTDDPPVLVWISPRLARDPQGGTQGFTFGLRTFGIPEFEVPHSNSKPNELLTLLGDLSLYVLREGDVIEDGHTVGMSEDHRILVRRTSSSFGHPGTVMKLLFS